MMAPHKPAAPTADTTSGAAAPPAGEAPHPDPRRRRIAPYLVLAIAIVFAAGAGAFYLTSAPPSTGSSREAVVAAATREIASLNTVSYQHVAAAEAAWGADTTGSEHSSVLAIDKTAATQIARNKTSSAGTVTALAVTSLGGGSASVIATVTVLQTASTGAANTVYNRYSATLTLTSAGWKISSLRNV
jgi:Mce-associated membrane protein